MKYTNDREFLKSMNINGDELNHVHDDRCMIGVPQSPDTCSQGYPLNGMTPIDTGAPKAKYDIIPVDGAPLNPDSVKVAEEAAEKYAGKVGFVHINGFYLLGIVVALSVATDKVTGTHKVMLGVHTKENGEGVCGEDEFEVVDKMP